MTEAEARAALVLPAGYAYQPGRSKGSKQHITTARPVGLCGIVTMSVLGGTFTSKPAKDVCSKCVRAAQKKGLGVRYE